MLQERILHTLAITKDLDQRKLSHIAGVSESSFSRYLNGLENITLHSALKIVKYLYPDQEKEIMAEYVLTQKSRNARFALEYCDINNLPYPFKKLIDELSKSVNPVDREWATYYELHRCYKEKVFSLDKLINDIDLFNPKELEIQIMKRFLKAYLAFNLNDKTAFRNQVISIEQMIKDVKNDFLKDCFNIRLGIVMSYVSFYANDLEETKYYSFMVVNQDLFEEVKALAYNHLGYTYMFENYDLSKYYFDKSYDIYTKLASVNKHNHKEIIELNISFLQSYWNIEREFTLDFKGNYKILANYIYYLIQKGDIANAKEYLNEINPSTLSKWHKAFYYYYLGLIHESKKYFYHSIKWFQRAEDFFHIKLPIDQLLEMGEDQDILSVWTH